MRLLIDGYNLMHAAIDMRPNMTPEALRAARTRFLDRLAERLGPIESALTTVVFDAADPPPGRPRTERHKGISVEFAIGPGAADDRIEELIRKHAHPKDLTVVSSDARLAEAARRRRARWLSADRFWSDLARRPKQKPVGPPSPPPAPDPQEAAYWREQFADVAADEDLNRALGPADFVPTAEEIERIEREVREEGGG